MNTYKDDFLKQGTSKWLQMRRNHIGASDAPIIMQQSPWRSPYQLWEEKLGLCPSLEINEAMKRGIRLEPIARKAYNDYTGNCADPSVVFHPKISFMMASLDGLSLDGSIIVEIKCAGKKDHEIAASGKIPDKYYAQLQHQLAVVGFDLLHYFSYTEYGFHLVEVERDEAFIEKLYAEEKDFWERVLNFDPPPLSDKDYIKREDESWVSIAREWSTINSKIKDLKIEEEKYKNSLIKMSSGKNCIGGGVRLQKVNRKGSVNYNEINELKGVDLERYRKPSLKYWKITD